MICKVLSGLLSLRARLEAQSSNRNRDRLENGETAPDGPLFLARSMRRLLKSGSQNFLRSETMFLGRLLLIVCAISSACFAEQTSYPCQPPPEIAQALAALPTPDSVFRERCAAGGSHRPLLYLTVKLT